MGVSEIVWPILDEMMTKRRDGASLRLAVDGPTYESKRFGKTSYLDASAILHSSAQMSAFIVNRSMDESMDVELHLAGAQVKRLANAEIVGGAGGGIDAQTSNTFEQPNRIVARPFSDVAMVGDNRATSLIKLPPLSMAGLTFELA